MKLRVYLGLLQSAERTLAESLRRVAEGHRDEPDVHSLCLLLAEQCDRHAAALAPVVARYGAASPDEEPERLPAAGMRGTRGGAVGLLRDLQDLYLLAAFVEITWTVVGQAGQALRDTRLTAVVGACDGQTSVQVQWLRTRIKQAAPQALVAAP